MIEVIHMYRDSVYEEYGRMDPLPEGYTTSAVYPILDVAVECGDEEKMEEGAEDTTQKQEVELQETRSQTTEPQEGVQSKEVSEPTIEQPTSHTISESEMDNQLLHLCIRVHLSNLSHL